MDALRKKVSAVLLLLCCAGAFLERGRAQSSNFQDLYEVQWSASHIQPLYNGQEVQLILDQSSGAGFQSKSLYTYGFFSVNMQLVAGNSAGTVTAYFLSSGGNYHDEIDFEFLGNETGQPYILQTNVFVNGRGEKEQRFYLPFDPTAGFHNYAILWNHQQIMFLVDNSPIRVFRNLQNLGVDYPSYQQVGAYSALFEASTWATRGGQVPIDWNAAPFVASYGDFKISACLNDGVNVLPCATNYQGNWWEEAQFNSLSTGQVSQLQNYHQTYKIYDYCTDVPRNPTPPLECAYNEYSS